MDNSNNQSWPQSQTPPTDNTVTPPDSFPPTNTNPVPSIPNPMPAWPSTPQPNPNTVQPQPEALTQPEPASLQSGAPNAFTTAAQNTPFNFSSNPPSFVTPTGYPTPSPLPTIPTTFPADSLQNPQNPSAYLPPQQNSPTWPEIPTQPSPTSFPAQPEPTQLVSDQAGLGPIPPQGTPLPTWPTQPEAAPTSSGPTPFQPTADSTGSAAPQIPEPFQFSQNPSLPGDPSAQYIDPNALAASYTSPSSPLDNPLSAPTQPPPIDGGAQNQQAVTSGYQQTVTSGNNQLPPFENQPSQPEPAWSPSQAATPPMPSNPQDNTDAAFPTNTNPTQQISEQAPTDLSHLISKSELDSQASQTAPETVVVPPVSAPEIPTIPTESKNSIPKWVIGLGLGLLIIVGGASAYFILGIGQPPKNTSLPAAEPPKATQQTNTPSTTPQPTVAPTTQPAATGSANFGQLQGSGTAPQASSAADILKARQQQGR